MLDTLTPSTVNVSEIRPNVETAIVRQLNLEAENRKRMWNKIKMTDETIDVGFGI